MLATHLRSALYWKARPAMTRIQPLVLVLWGDQFDEAAATLFVATLRDAGVRVQVVGVDGRRASGRRGLQMSADLSIHRALALSQVVTHVVLPCAATHYRRLREDPLVTQLLGRTAAAGAQFVIGVPPATCSDEHSLPLPATDPPLPLERIQVYPARALEEFADGMARVIQMTRPESLPVNPEQAE